MRDTMDNNDLFDFMKEEILPDIRIEAVKEIDKHFFAVSKIIALANFVVIDDRDSCDRALDVAGDLRSLYKQIEDARKKAVEPSRKIIQMINECAKKFHEVLGEAEAGLKIKLAKWQLSQEIKATEAQKAVKELSATLGLDIQILAPDAPKNMSSDKASTCMKEKRSFEILDASLIPDEYWVIDEKLIAKHIAMGKTDIPGIVITTEKQMIIRRK